MDMRIYNLYPRLYRQIDDWYAVADRAAEMQFNAIYLNPFFATGKSDSVYSIRDYYNFDERIFGDYTRKKSVEKLKAFLCHCRQLGLHPILDLVVNHTAIDSPLVRQCPQWYRWEATGEISKPCFMENAVLKRWQDCAWLDYTRDEGLADWVIELCCYYLDMGFQGFRCDVAGYVPAFAWQKIIAGVRQQYPQAFFMAEAFMVSPDTLCQLGRAGFDYCYSSSRWWNFRLEEERSKTWFFQNLDSIHAAGMMSISFPDNHDTARLMTEYDGNVHMVRQELFLMGVIGSAFQITTGFEYGYRNRIHVVKTDYRWQEETQVDLTEDIKRVNQLRMQYPVFRQEGQFRVYPQDDARLLVLHKVSDEQQALIVLNCTAETVEVSVQRLFYAFAQRDAALRDFSLAPYGFWFHVMEVKKNSVLSNLSICLIDKQKVTLLEKQLAPRMAGEALVKIEACGICGSDRQEFRQGLFYWPTEDSGGHELAGTVIEISSPEYGLRVGDYVTYCIPRAGCGVSQGGGFSQYAVVRNDCLVKLDRSIRPEIAALIEPLACAVHAAHFLGAARKVAIVGSGPIALLLERVIHQGIKEQNTHRTVTLFYKHDLIVHYLHPQTNAVPYCETIPSPNPWESFDVICDCSGSEHAARWAMNRLSDNGRLILMGIYRTEGIIWPLSTLMFGEKAVIGSFLYTRQDFEEAHGFIREGIVQVEDMIHVWDANEYHQAFQQPSGISMKDVLLWKGE